MTLSHPPKTPSRGATPVPTPAAQGAARFTKADRLRHRSEFLRVQAQGKRLQTRHFGVVLAPPAATYPRLGLVVTRRLGKAARRNRVKRLLREFFRRHQRELPVRDLIIMAKKGATTLNYHQVAEELGRLLLQKNSNKDANHD